MGIDESEVTRLLRGDMPNDDPAWGEVSSFLRNVETAYPAVPTTALEGSHLAAVARESRLVQSERRHPRQGAVKRLVKRTHRVLAGSVGAALIVLTAGVGVAGALGINPLEQLIRSVVPSVAPLTPQTEASDDPANGARDQELGTASPRALPNSTPNPTPNPTPSLTPSKTQGPNPASTKAPGTVGDEHKSNRATEKANNGKATAKPTPPRATPSPKASPKAAPTPPGKNKGSGASVVDAAVTPG